MKYLAWVLLLASSSLNSRQAAAQGFWYVPPGYGYGYYYGLDFGHGVGFGYGAGVGIPVTPEVLMSHRTGSTGPLVQPAPRNNAVPPPAFTKAAPQTPVATKGMKAKKPVKSKGPKAANAGK